MNSNPVKNIFDSSDFAALRQKGCIYVDKTWFLHRLVTWNGFSRFFVARPRRFGKSLMISTLKYILQGQKELFKGTYIYDKTDYDWPVVSVIHLDFSSLDVTSEATFDDALATRMKVCLAAAVPGYIYQEQRAPQSNFELALCDLYAGSGSAAAPVAILVDEYDAPIGHALDRLEMAEYVRAKLESIYGIIKTHVDKVRFLMLTGVSKFSQLSIFSGLNNLTDLYRYDEFATMFGYTDWELDDNFGELMQVHAKKMKLSYDVYQAELKRWFNGYCFNAGKETVYNPMAIAKTLSEQAKVFRSTWTAECRPSMLVNFISRGIKAGIDFDRPILVKPEQLGNVARLDKLKLVDILYQSGYLTIGRYDESANRLVLRVPDDEIDQDLSFILLEFRDDGNMHDTAELRAALVEGKINRFIAELKPFYASFVYGSAENVVYEAVYRRDLMIALRSEGFHCVPEAEQANGNRADLVVTYGKFVYVLELKRAAAASADDALQQIVDRDYVAPYARPGYTLFQVGLAFDDKTHHLIDAKAQSLEIAVPEVRSQKSEVRSQKSEV